jgi:Zn-dependent peptidase ImmA (M78 family)
MKQAEINYLAKDAATRFRRQFDLGDADPIHIETVLNKLKLLTVFAQMSDNFSGMAAKIDGNRFLLINCAHTRGRQIFTICHELYHLYIQETFEFEVISHSTKMLKDDQEKLADAFASELLIPEKGIQELVIKENYIGKTIVLDHVIKLEHYFQVSRAAMVYRLISLGFLDKSTEHNPIFMSNVKDAALKRGYEINLYEPSKPRIISSDYFEKAQHLYNKDKIGLADYAQLLHDIGIDLFALLDENHPDQ